jgi:hypothetical protein
MSTRAWAVATHLMPDCATVKAPGMPLKRKLTRRLRQSQEARVSHASCAC